MPFTAALTPSAAIERLKADDPTLVTCDLSKNAVLQMKSAELMPQLADALAKNTKCQELKLVGCSIDDAACAELARGLERNCTLVLLNLEDNRVLNDGALHLARALGTNRGLMHLNLLNQKGARYGDTTLTAYLNAFDTNVTLLKIVWRLESRQSFRLTKMLTRNNDIDRRIKSGREYSDLLPSGVAPLSPALILQRATQKVILAPTRGASDDALPRSEPSAAVKAAQELAAKRKSQQSARDSDQGEEDVSPPGKSPAAISAALRAELAALDAQQAEAIAKLEADFVAKRAALVARHADAPVAPAVLPPPGGAAPERPRAGTVETANAIATDMMGLALQDAVDAE